MSAQIRFKNQRAGEFYCLIVSASMLIYGYSLTMLSASDLKYIRQYYNIDFADSILLSTINGFFGVGGLIASFLTPYFLKLTTKRKSYYIFTFGAILSSALSLIPNIGSLYFSKFILGMNSALSIGIAGMYIRQTFSERLRRTYGAIYSLAKCLGTQICYIVGYVLNSSNISSSAHLIIFSGVGILTSIQLIFVFFYLPEIPVEMLSLKKFDTLNRTMFRLYKEQQIPLKIKQLQKQEKDMKVSPSLLVRASRHKIVSALHCGLLRQFCGAPYVIVYSIYIIGNLHSDYTNVAPIIINTVQLIAAFLGLWIVVAIKRSKMISFSTLFTAILSFLLAIGDGMRSSAFCLTIMIIYMVPTASCLQSVAWFYPFECTGPLYGKYAAMLSWFGTTCLLIIPPFITEAMPHHQSYPIFIFFGVYMCFSVYINARYLVSMDTDQKDIVKEKVVIQLANITNKTQLQSTHQ